MATTEGYIPATRRPRAALPRATALAQRELDRQQATPIFRVFLIEVKTRNSRTEPWCPTLGKWFHTRPDASDQAELLRALHPTKVYRVRRYLPTAEVVRG